MIRGLHYHERGQDDLFVCLQGMVRVVVLDRESGETRSARTSATRTRSRSTSPAATPTATRRSPTALFCYLVTEEYDADDPDEHGIPWNDPRVVHLWSTRSPLLSQRDAAAAS